MLKGKIRIFVLIAPAVLLMVGILGEGSFCLNKLGKVCTPERNTYSESGCANLPEQNKVYQPDKPLKSEIIQKAQRLQMPFVANEGQIDGHVSFYAKTFGGTVFVTKKGEIVYSLPMNSWESGVENSETQGEGSGNEIRSSENKARNQKLNPKSNTTGIALKEEIVGAQVMTVQGEQTSVTKVNYLKGNDPSQWKTNISTYNEVNLGDVYEGIGLRLRAYGNNVEKIFCIKPGSHPDQINVQIHGVKSLKVNEKGLLDVDTELGPVSFTKPIAYQEIDGKRVDVEAEYVIRDRDLFSNKNTGHETRVYSFTVASYDKNKDLVIDPMLASTFLGGSANEYPYSLAIDSGGNVFVVGDTYSSGFPTTIGAYDTSFNGGGDDDAFVSRLNGDLTTILASTFLGGSGGDHAISIATDSAGSVFVAGLTSSSDFPTTPGTYDTFYNGGSSDAFILKLNGGLSSLLASTFIGGSSSEWVNPIVTDSGGGIIVAGDTYSSDFPTTIGAYDTSFNGGDHDAFVSRLSGDLTTLLASTFLGGSGGETAHSIAIDKSGNICVIGPTYSSDFPTTPGAYDTSYSGDGDAFVSKLNEDLTTILASTFLGGSGIENGNTVAVNSDGDIYVTGHTQSPSFPTTPGAYDTSYNGNGDIYVSKLDKDLTTILVSTFLGGSAYENNGNSIAIDSNGNIYVIGLTTSSDFPTTPGAYDTFYNGGSSDVHISRISGDLTNLIASTFIGGSRDDIGNTIKIDSIGNIYAVGYTSSSGFPTTPGAYDTSYNGGGDGFVSKFDSDLSASPTAIELVSFTASTNDNGTVNLIWETATEVDNAGFNIYRAKSKDGRYKKINDELIGAKGDAVAGATYNFMDTPGRGTFYYKLEDVDYSGATTMHGPIKVRIKSITD